METNEQKLPLGILRQAVMKIESFAIDMREAAEDPDIDPEDKAEFEKQAEVAGTMMARIVNMVSKELGEEEFLSEEFNMDEIDAFPGSDVELGDEPIDLD